MGRSTTSPTFTGVTCSRYRCLPPSRPFSISRFRLRDKLCEKRNPFVETLGVASASGRLAGRRLATGEDRRARVPETGSDDLTAAPDRLPQKRQ